LRLHATDVVVGQTPDDAAKIALELRPADLVWGEYHPTSFFAARGRHDDPIADVEIFPIGAEVVDSPGIAEPNADHALGRRSVVEAENGVTFATSALTNLLARFEAALETLARTGARLIDGRRRRPGSV
jgi:hypothetical protein